MVHGFRHGFDLRYNGSTDVCRLSPNLKIRISSDEEMWSKVMKEVKGGLYADPFEKPPFDNFIQSPIGLVPKDHGTKTRVIFHL